jgi:cyclopropane-fatty-acyl-phospholipid synthase
LVSRSVNRERWPTTTGLDRLARRALDLRLERLVEGALIISDDTGSRRFGVPRADLAAQVEVHRSRFYRRTAFGGALGIGAAYIDGDWDCDDLVTLFRVFLRNERRLGRFDGGMARLRRPIDRLRHWARTNTRSGSRRNIRDHYDLGNDLFRLFLDRSMTYSAALFDRSDQRLDEAQAAKLDRICRKLELAPHHHVLEIGTGWGSFAIHAAQHYGCHVTTTTISPAQRALAAERVRAAGVDDRVTLLSADYRELEGEFDRLVSIEMIEAVGEDHLATFLACCSERLRDDGRMALQTITTGEHFYAHYRRSVDFIQRYVFPGGHTPALSALLRAAGGASDLRLTHIEDLTPDYALTLRRWRTNFWNEADAVRGLGYPERFLRLWDYYLQYCEAGFSERHVADLQLILDKPDNPQAPIRPPIGWAHAS